MVGSALVPIFQTYGDALNGPKIGYPVNFININRFINKFITGFRSIDEPPKGWDPTNATVIAERQFLANLKRHLKWPRFKTM